MQIHNFRSVAVGSIIWLAIILSTSIQAAPTEGLVVYYPFNDNALDESGNGNHGLAVGAVLAEDRFGRANSAYYFDGVDDTVWIVNSPSLNVQSAVTISAWFYLDSYPNGWVSIVNKRSSYILQIHPQYGLTLTLYDNNFKGVWRNVPAQKDFVLGQWYHVVASYDEIANVARIYLNGLPMAVEARLDYGYPTAINSGGDDMKLGSEQANQWWHGAIDDVRIYDRALNDTEVTELFNETPLAAQSSIDLSVDSLQIDLTTGEIHLKANVDPTSPLLQTLATNPEVRLSLQLQTQSGSGTVQFGPAAQGQVTAETLLPAQLLRYGSLPEESTEANNGSDQQCGLNKGDRGGFYKRPRQRKMNNSHHDRFHDRFYDNFYDIFYEKQRETAERRRQ
jgi:hypothetical protein